MPNIPRASAITSPCNDLWLVSSRQQVDVGDGRTHYWVRLRVVTNIIDEHDRPIPLTCGDDGYAMPPARYTMLTGDEFDACTCTAPDLDDSGFCSQCAGLCTTNDIAA